MVEAGARLERRPVLRDLWLRFARWAVLTPAIAWLLVVVNLGSAVPGYLFWYGDSLSAAPWYLWLFVPDSPPAAASGFTRWYGISGPGELTFAAAATTTPTLPGTISDARVELLQAPSPDGLDLISVTLFTAAGGSPTITGASCSFNPNTETGCTIPGKVTVPAGSRVAWRVLAFKGGAIPTFDAFKVGLAYTIATG